MEKQLKREISHSLYVLLYTSCLWIVFNESSFWLTESYATSILTKRLGGSGAATPFETRQVREEAAVQRRDRVPPGNRPKRIS